MKDDIYFFKFDKTPGKDNKNILKENKTNYKSIISKSPLVTIVTSFYNSEEYMDETVNSVLNQTFPFWEWIIVDDGSTNESSIEYLKNLKDIDKRIRILKKENGGLAKGRDFAIRYANSDLIIPLDADDLIERTYIETLYWSLETNKEASFAFSDSVGFGKYRYLSDCKFDSERMKTENHITATALIKKEKIIELGGYQKAKRYVNEDWHLWLRMLQKGYRPCHVSYYGFWYRRRENSLLTDINNEENSNNKLRLRDLKIEADKINKKVYEIGFGSEEDLNEEKEDSNEKIHDNVDKNLNNNICEIENLEECYQDLIYKKNTTLYILKNTGQDSEVFKEIKNKKRETNNRIIIVTLNLSEESQYVYRQKYEEFVDSVYNLKTFIKKDYYLKFITYLIETRNVKEIYIDEDLKEIKNNLIMNYIDNSNKENLKNKEIEFNDIFYEENPNIYNFKIKKYKFDRTFIMRGIRKIFRIIFRKDII